MSKKAEMLRNANLNGKRPPDKAEEVQPLVMSNAMGVQRAQPSSSTLQVPERPKPLTPAKFNSPTSSSQRIVSSAPPTKNASKNGSFNFPGVSMGSPLSNKGDCIPAKEMDNAVVFKTMGDKNVLMNDDDEYLPKSVVSSFLVSPSFVYGRVPDVRQFHGMWPQQLPLEYMIIKPSGDLGQKGTTQDVDQSYIDEISCKAFAEREGFPSNMKDSMKLSLSSPKWFPDWYSFHSPDVIGLLKTGVQAEICGFSIGKQYDWAMNQKSTVECFEHIVTLAKEAKNGDPPSIRHTTLDPGTICPNISKELPDFKAMQNMLITNKNPVFRVFFTAYLENSGRDADLSLCCRTYNIDLKAYPSSGKIKREQSNVKRIAGYLTAAGLLLSILSVVIMVIVASTSMSHDRDNFTAGFGTNKSAAGVFYNLTTIPANATGCFGIPGNCSFTKVSEIFNEPAKNKTTHYINAVDIIGVSNPIFTITSRTTDESAASKDYSLAMLCSTADIPYGKTVPCARADSFCAVFPLMVFCGGSESVAYTNNFQNGLNCLQEYLLGNSASCPGIPFTMGKPQDMAKHFLPFDLAWVSQNVMIMKNKTTGAPVLTNFDAETICFNSSSTTFSWETIPTSDDQLVQYLNDTANRYGYKIPEKFTVSDGTSNFTTQCFQSNKTTNLKIRTKFIYKYGDTSGMTMQVIHHVYNITKVASDGNVTSYSMRPVFSVLSDSYTKQRGTMRRTTGTIINSTTVSEPGCQTTLDTGIDRDGNRFIIACVAVPSPSTICQARAMESTTTMSPNGYSLDGVVIAPEGKVCALFFSQNTYSGVSVPVSISCPSANIYCYPKTSPLIIGVQSQTMECIFIGNCSPTFKIAFWATLGVVIMLIGIGAIVIGWGKDALLVVAKYAAIGVWYVVYFLMMFLIELAKLLMKPMKLCGKKAKKAYNVADAALNNAQHEMKNPKKRKGEDVLIKEITNSPKYYEIRSDEISETKLKGKPSPDSHIYANHCAYGEYVTAFIPPLLNKGYFKQYLNSAKNGDPVYEEILEHETDFYSETKVQGGLKARNPTNDDVHRIYDFSKLKPSAICKKFCDHQIMSKMAYDDIYASKQGEEVIYQPTLADCLYANYVKYRTNCISAAIMAYDKKTEQEEYKQPAVYGNRFYDIFRRVYANSRNTLRTLAFMALIVPGLCATGTLTPIETGQFSNNVCNADLTSCKVVGGASFQGYILPGSYSNASTFTAKAPDGSKVSISPTFAGYVIDSPSILSTQWSLSFIMCNGTQSNCEGKGWCSGTNAVTQILAECGPACNSPCQPDVASRDFNGCAPDCFSCGSGEFAVRCEYDQIPRSNCIYFYEKPVSVRYVYGHTFFQNSTMNVATNFTLNNVGDTFVQTSLGNYTFSLPALPSYPSITQIAHLPSTGEIKVPEVPFSPNSPSPLGFMGDMMTYATAGCNDRATLGRISLVSGCGDPGNAACNYNVRQPTVAEFSNPSGSFTPLSVVMANIGPVKFSITNVTQNGLTIPVLTTTVADVMNPQTYEVQEVMSFDALVVPGTPIVQITNVSSVSCSINGGRYCWVNVTYNNRGSANSFDITESSDAVGFKRGTCSVVNPVVGTGMTLCTFITVSTGTDVCFSAGTTKVCSLIPAELVVQAPPSILTLSANAAQGTFNTQVSVDGYFAVIAYFTPPTMVDYEFKEWIKGVGGKILSVLIEMIWVFLVIPLMVIAAMFTFHYIYVVIICSKVPVIVRDMAMMASRNISQMGLKAIQVGAASEMTDPKGHVRMNSDGHYLMFYIVYYLRSNIPIEYVMGFWGKANPFEKSVKYNSLYTSVIHELTNSIIILAIEGEEAELKGVKLTKKQKSEVSNTESDFIDVKLKGVNPIMVGSKLFQFALDKNDGVHVDDPKVPNPTLYDKSNVEGKSG